MTTEHSVSLKELAKKPEQLAGGHRLCAGCVHSMIVRQIAHGRRRAGGRRRRDRLPRGRDLDLPVHGVAGALDPQRLRERRGHRLRHRGDVPVAEEAGQAPRGHRASVHRLRRRRRHLRHRPAVALRRHGARPPAALRLLRQRRVHEHRHPALERHADGRLDDHLAGRQGQPRQDAVAQGPDRDHRGAPHPLRRPGLAAATGRTS